MTEESNPVERPARRRWIAIAVAVLVPTALTVAFWRTTPTVGGWGKGTTQEETARASAVDYSQNGRMPLGAAATDPKSLYLRNCASCHGADLEGGRIGPALKTPKWPYGKDRDLLVKVIHQGRGLSMPGFEGRLNNQQIESLTVWLQEQNGVGK